MDNAIKMLHNLSFSKILFILFILGIFSSLSLQPFNLLFLLFICLPGFIKICDIFLYNQSKITKYFLIKIFLLGWSFGFGYFLLSLYWVNISYLNDIEKYYLFIIPSIILLPGFIAIFYGLITLSLILFYPKNITRVFIFSISWTLIEYLRSLITGFPWAQIGHSLIPINLFLQITSIFGELFLTTITILIFSFPLIYYLEENRLFRGKCLFAFILIISLITIYGMYRHNQIPEVNKNIELNIIQPNISQEEKWDINLLDTNIEKIKNLTLELVKIDRGKETKKRYFILPETTLPILVEENLVLIEQITNQLNKDDYLLMGTIRREVDNDENIFYNGFIILNNKNQIVGIYNKNKLVPFGEYIPFNSSLQKLNLEFISAIAGNFRKGSHPPEIDPEIGSYFDVLICYEIIFSQNLYDQNKDIDWILNITNDAWFGLSSGPFQHFDMAILRAVERGRPIVRVANTGISGIIDGRGKVIKKIPLNNSGTISEKLPPKLSTTIYSRFNYYPLFLIMAISFILLYCINLKNYNPPSKLTKRGK
tara:strand:- start:67012 stop:68628 length:1617 start_codon:yes stop_codon:yes gene_type:complete